MKLFKCLFLFAFLSITSVFADPVSKPQRLNSDSKIIGYAVIKDPSVFYAKFVKLANTIYPGSSAAIEQQIAPVKAILDSSVSIAVVLYANETFEKEPLIGVYITVKDKKVFDNPLLGLMPEKEVIENTLVVSVKPGGLAKFKEFQKIVAALTPQKDLEFYVDLKNITKLNEELISKKTPYAKDIYSQVEMVVVKVNLLDTGIEQSACLITTDKSNLQTMLTHPGLDSTSLLKFTGAGNFMSAIASYDLSKGKGFVQDLIKMANLIPDIGEEEKKQLKAFEPIALDFCTSDSVVTASSMSFDTTIKSKYLTKVKDPAKELARIKAIYTQLGSTGIKNLLEKSVFKGMYEFKWEEVEKINGLQVFKLSSLSKEKIEEMKKLTAMPTDQYFAVDKDYCYSSTDLVSLKELIDTVKAIPKTDTALESFNFFKSGNSMYADLYFIGYFKLFEGILANFGGVKLTSLLALKLPPFKMAFKLDGNLTEKSFIETSTITTLVQKGIEIYSQAAMNNNQGDGGAEEMPKSQP